MKEINNRTNLPIGSNNPPSLQDKISRRPVGIKIISNNSKSGDNRISSKMHNQLASAAGNRHTNHR